MLWEILLNQPLLRLFEIAKKGDRVRDVCGLQRFLEGTLIFSSAADDRGFAKHFSRIGKYIRDSLHDARREDGLIDINL